MKNFISINDVVSVKSLVNDALELKVNPLLYEQLGKNKTIGLVFFNPSLRTRLSTQKAALNLGMKVMELNIHEDSWKLEMNDNAVMNGNNVEHIKDAAAMLNMYCDVIAIRCFPSLTNKENDDNEIVFTQFLKYCTKPIISMESATLHPLQSFADTITISENWDFNVRKPKVVLCWAPHVKPLPHAVPNSFCEWMSKSNVDFTITHPIGYELNTKFTESAVINYDQQNAIKEADFIYIKSWSSYNNYGEMPAVISNWLLTTNMLLNTNNAKIMHCLPVRRNVEVLDEILDGPNSLIMEQAANRVFATQAVLKNILQH